MRCAIRISIFSSQKIYGVWLICEVRLIFNTSALKLQAYSENLFWEKYLRSALQRLFITEIACATLEIK